MIIDNLDIRDLNRCTNYCKATDSFNRPDMTQSLGVSDIGIAWIPAGGGGNFGITSGRLTQFDGDGGYNAMGLPVLMEIPIHATFEIWPVDTTFTIITTLVCGDVTAIVQYRQWEGDGTLGDIVISLSDGTNFITANTASIVVASGMSAVVTIDLTADTLTTSIGYGYGNSGSSVFVTTAGASPGPIAPITEAATNWAWNIDAPYGTVGIDNLNVGAGNCADPNHPCYQECAGSSAPTDTFTRTVAHGWGVSDSGNVWANIGPDTTSVDGSRGIINSFNGCDACGGEIGLGFYIVPLTEISIDMDGSTSAYSGSQSISGYNSGNLNSGFMLEFAPEGGGSGTLSLNVSASEFVYGNDSASISLDVGAPNRWKVSYVSGALKAKAWNTSGSEPGWQLSVTIIQISITSLRVKQHNGGSDDACLIYVDNLWIAGVGGCVDINPDGSSTTTTNAVGQKACDQIVPLDPPVTIYGDTVYVSGTRWQTTQATYIPGTTKLAVNGIFQFFKYLESDPDNGIITANIDIYPSDVVTLCYLTNGPLP